MALGGSQYISELGTAILAMHMIGVMPQLRHQLGKVLCIGRRIVALARRGPVGIAKAAQVGGDDSEVLGQQRYQLVPIEVGLGGAVDQKQRLALTRRDIMHADAVDPGPAMPDRRACVIENLGHPSPPDGVLRRFFCESRAQGDNGALALISYI